MSTKHKPGRGLGRGLSALMADVKDSASSDQTQRHREVDQNVRDHPQDPGPAHPELGEQVGPRLQEEDPAEGHRLHDDPCCR